MACRALPRTKLTLSCQSPNPNISLAVMEACRSRSQALIDEGRATQRRAIRAFGGKWTTVNHPKSRKTAFLLSHCTPPLP